MLQHRDQPVVVDQRTSLQKLPQLVDLDALIHPAKPLLRLLYSLAVRGVYLLIQRGTGRRINHKLAS
jgi:hypothetical protein